MERRMTPGRKRFLFGAGLSAVTLMGLAALVALAPVTDGDNYCGRLYFDTSRGAACRSTMAARTAWFVALTTASVLVWTAGLAVVRSRRLLLVTVFGAIAIGGVLVGLNRLLEPTPPPSSAEACCAVMVPTMQFERVAATGCSHRTAGRRSRRSSSRR